MIDVNRKMLRGALLDIRGGGRLGSFKKQKSPRTWEGKKITPNMERKKKSPSGSKRQDIFGKFKKKRKEKKRKEKKRKEKKRKEKKRKENKITPEGGKKKEKKKKKTHPIAAREKRKMK